MRKYLSALVQLPMVREAGKERIRASKDAADILWGMGVQDSAVETFWVLLLNARNAVINHVLITIGTADSAYVNPRDVFRPAIEAGAVSLICAHNHPTGCTSPSRQDAEISRQLLEAGRIVGIKMLDHIILGRKTDGEQGYYSFADSAEL